MQLVKANLGFAYEPEEIHISASEPAQTVQPHQTFLIKSSIFIAAKHTTILLNRFGKHIPLVYAPSTRKLQPDPNGSSNFPDGPISFFRGAQQPIKCKTYIP